MYSDIYCSNILIEQYTCICGVYLRCWWNSSIFLNKIPQELSVAVACRDLSTTQWEGKNEGSGTDYIPATVA